MSQPPLARLSVADFVAQFRAEMIPLSSTFSYFFAGLPLTEDDVKEYLDELIAALPPVVVRAIPKAAIFLVPFLERTNGRDRRHGAAPPGSHEYISLERPAENKSNTHLNFRMNDGAVLLFAVKDVELADYHYRFYQQMAALAETTLGDEARAEYSGILRDELSTNVHGEVDEQSWHHKQLIRRRTNTIRPSSKGFREYLRHSFIDTLTLYLHGICCDIDVETGPRQLPSRFLRKRLLWMESAFPPPEGYAVFPEELSLEIKRK